MPGISIYLTENHQQKFHPVVDYFPNYYVSNIIKKDNLVIDSVQYKEYPLKRIETNSYIIIIEGSIYPWKDSIVKQIERSVDLLIDSADTGLLKSFIHKTDGEFIITVFQKGSRKVIVFNDYLGRLPLYYSKKQMIITREIGFITGNFKLDLDRFSIAEYLLLGFPLGNKTLYCDVNVLMPGSVIYYEYKEHNIKISKLVETNFEESISSKISLKEAAGNLHDLFLDACKYRSNTKNNVLLSLSGGLDSRALLAAFKKQNIDYRIATYQDYDKTADSDIRVVKKLVSHSDKVFHLIELDEPNALLDDMLFGMKQGMNYLGMSFILDYYNKIQQSELSFFTGDGGDKTLPNLRPLRPLISNQDLVSYIISMNHIFDLTEIYDLTGISPKRLKEHLMETFVNYPEKSPRNKHIRFMMMERGFKWLFEGEDRNRYFFDQQAPFYSVPFYQYSMQLDSSLKKNFRLFKEFLYLLDKDMASIENANWGFPINETNKLRWIYSKQGLKSIFPPAFTNPKRKRKSFLPIEAYLQTNNFNALFSADINKNKRDYLRTLLTIMRSK